ncbi:hypothetical protein RAAC3_TM7C00001G0898 [Candidatus Saccharibacteria bacterium RAAC3_TM7_1]|nr:hypothetical protein RAAC3_TM7C00001G0898 [Candidatus Saccharibacteria bacterium RAAC3_TM7_1]HCZ28195.1 hypothetical protein [Candidatus Saccharibacteria bacterium]
MANDKVRFERALRKWDTLHEEKAYSVPRGSGVVAILASDRALADEKAGTEDLEAAMRERQAFQDEAYRIAETLTTNGVGTRLFPAFTLENVSEVLADPSVSSIVTIGNGNLSEVWAHQGVCVSWDFIADHTTHLKTGYFMQRQCGHVAYHLSVPLGTFAMADHSNVFAALDKYLPPVLTPADEAYITQLHDERRLGIEAVRRLFALDKGLLD